MALWGLLGNLYWTAKGQPSQTGLGGPDTEPNDEPNEDANTTGCPFAGVAEGPEAQRDLVFASKPVATGKEATMPKSIACPQCSSAGGNQLRLLGRLPRPYRCGC